ncbi:unnamed protein product [Gemmataceae bacterium]|nr:unnamed protein product [Gemmataceae bacterium]VTT98239.1 unnamed protein product [Gemmataceae bacterium]
MTAGLLALSFAVAAPPVTGLQRGDEFTFTGTVAEGVSRAPDFFRRNHALELRLLVLDRQENWADVTVLTRLQRTADAVGGAVGAVTGGAAKDFPPIVRLDVVRVHSDGTVHLLSPVGPAPLKLAANTPARALPPTPLDSFPVSEFGVFPPPVPRGNGDDPWTVASAGNRPSQTWQAKGFEFIHAERCRLLAGNQASPNWEKPVGGQTAWHRADAVWVSTQDGTARKVHRVIRHRDGRSEAAAAWVEVKYELKDQGRLGGQTFDRVRRDVDVAYFALADAAQLLPDAQKLGPKTFEARIARLDAQLEETDPASPYREAMLAARRMLDDGRDGKPAALQPVVATVPAVPASRLAAPEVGQLAPDVSTGVFRLAEQRGTPVLLVFFRPGGETSAHALAIAGALEKRYAGNLVVAPLVVFGDAATAARDRDGLKLKLPLYDGAKAVAAYGVETAPRFVLVDGAGKVAWAFAGVGAETGYLAKEQADRLAAPAFPDGATGTSPAGVPVLPPIVPRP